MVSRTDIHARVGVKKTATMLALDKDFYFSLVFQSGDQKDQFMKAFAEKFGMKIDAGEGDAIDMVNGIRFAERLGIELKKEPLHGFPVADPLLLPFVLNTIEAE